MFGGVGLYSRDLFFGLIDDDTLFFKTDETNCAPYQARSMPRFMPPADRPVGRKLPIRAINRGLDRPRALAPTERSGG